MGTVTGQDTAVPGMDADMGMDAGADMGMDAGAELPVDGAAELDDLAADELDAEAPIKTSLGRGRR
jgi:hypothetical protein